MSSIPINKVSIGEAVSWVGRGWKIFAGSVGMWLLIGLIDVLISTFIQLIPYLGMLVIFAVSPVFAAGFQYAAREASEGRAVRLEYLFQGFREPGRLGPLLGLGGIYLGSLMVLALATFGLFVGADSLEGKLYALTVSASGLEGPGQTSLLMDKGLRLLLILLIALSLLLPVMMAMYYAPPLVMFKGASVGQALWSSLRACFRNFWPLTVFGLVLFLLLLLVFALISLVIVLPILFGAGVGQGASITAGVVIGVLIALVLMFVIWIPLMPILMGMNYSSYRSVYG